MCLDASEDLIDGSGVPSYMAHLRQADLPAGVAHVRAAVFATEDGDAFGWEVLCRCLEALCAHVLCESHTLVLA